MAMSIWPELSQEYIDSLTTDIHSAEEFRKQHIQEWPLDASAPKREKIGIMIIGHRMDMIRREADTYNHRYGDLCHVLALRYMSGMAGYRAHIIVVLDPPRNENEDRWLRHDVFLRRAGPEALVVGY